MSLILITVTSTMSLLTYFLICTCLCILLKLSIGKHGSQRKYIVLLGVYILLLSSSFLNWKNNGWAMKTKHYSPQKNFYISYYALDVIPDFFHFTLPGQGSDYLGGYIRLYSKDGVLLKEVYTDWFYGVEFFWERDSITLLGGVNRQWKLPD